MTILTSYTSPTFKAQIRSSVETGFKQLYTASSTSCEMMAARAVVRKNFGYAAAETVRLETDAGVIRKHVGKFFDDPQRKQVFSIWSFVPNA